RIHNSHRRCGLESFRIRHRTRAEPRRHDQRRRHLSLTIVDRREAGSSCHCQLTRGGAVQYLLLICLDPSLQPDGLAGEIEAWLDRVGEQRLAGGPLQPARTATTARVRGGARLLTDGPFAETKELVAGFDVIECDSREEAIDIAATHPVTKFGA